MSIGEALIRARREAGLSVADVSRRTRIRETIINGIERDDFSLCGGDFYARGHIRAIARVIGIDSEPLIEEYDAAHLGPDTIPGARWPPGTIPGGHRPIETISGYEAGEPVTPIAPHDPVTPEVPVTPEEPATPEDPATRYEPATPEDPATRYEPATPREPPAPPGAVSPHQPVTPPEPVLPHGPVTPDEFGQPTMPGPPVTQGAPFTSGRRRATGGRRRIARPTLGAAASPDQAIGPDEPAGPRTPVTHRRRRVNWSAVLGLALLAVVGAGGYLLASGGHSQHETSTASSHRASSHPSPHPTPTSTTPSPAPTQTAAPAHVLNPVNIAAFGPGGAGEGDNPQLASFALDDNAATPWHSDWYTTPQFGNLQPGTGLLLDMGRTVTLTDAQIAVGDVTGGDIQLRVGGTPALADLLPVAHGTGAAGTVRFRPGAPSHGRYVLIWFTRLPQDQAGTFQASVYGVKLQGST